VSSATFSRIPFRILARGRRLRRPALRLARYRSAAMFWILTIVLGVITARWISAASQPYPQSWGALTPVVVITKSLSAGSIVTATDVAVRQIPSAFVPQRHGRTLQQIVGRRASISLMAGAAVDLSQMSPGSSSAISESIGVGHRGVALAADTAPTGLAPGDLVQIFVNRDGDGELVAMVSEAKVIRLAERQVLVSVTEPDAKRLAGAISNGRPTLALIGG
jgi:Flp pilus assembly protein CpaB